MQAIEAHTAGSDRGEFQSTVPRLRGRKIQRECYGIYLVFLARRSPQELKGSYVAVASLCFLELSQIGPSKGHRNPVPLGNQKSSSAENHVWLIFKVSVLRLACLGYHNILKVLRVGLLLNCTRLWLLSCFIYLYCAHPTCKGQ